MKQIHIHAVNRTYTVGKIVCIGQNYIEHAREMNFDVPKTPVFFLKPSTAIVYNKSTVILPEISKNVQHEVELVILIGKDGKNISQDAADDYIAGIGIGLDMTMRDIQLDAKQKGLPWALAKGFDTSAPISDFIPYSENLRISQLKLELRVNDEIRQEGNCNEMVFSVPQLLSYISQFITLEQGDLLFTGTPAGVGAVKNGDLLKASLLHKLDNRVLAELEVTVQAQP